MRAGGVSRVEAAKLVIAFDRVRALFGPGDGGMPAWVRLTKQKASGGGSTLLAGLPHIQYCLHVGIIDPFPDDEGRSCVHHDHGVRILRRDRPDQLQLLVGQRGDRGSVRDHVACLVVYEHQRERFAFGIRCRIGNVPVGAETANRTLTSELAGREVASTVSVTLCQPMEGDSAQRTSV